MFRYLIQRMLIMIPTLLLISLIVFVIIQLPPGDYLESYVAELRSEGEDVDPAKIEFLRQQYGFDKPLIEQYGIWVFGLLQGDLGFSFEYQLPVSQVVGDRLWLTFIVSYTTIFFTRILRRELSISSALRMGS